MSQKFFNILLCASLQHVYQMTKAVQAMEGAYCGWWYHGSWCADILCIVSLYVGIESFKDEVQHNQI